MLEEVLGFAGLKKHAYFVDGGNLALLRPQGPGVSKVVQDVSVAPAALNSWLNTADPDSWTCEAKLSSTAYIQHSEPRILHNKFLQTCYMT